jgi:hypothetical protein
LLTFNGARAEISTGCNRRLTKIDRFRSTELDTEKLSPFETILTISPFETILTISPFETILANDAHLSGKDLSQSLQFMGFSLV